MPTTTPTDAHRSKAATIVGSMSDATLQRLLTADIAQALADASAASPTAIDAEQQLLREIVPLLNALPYSAGPFRRIDSHSIPSHVLTWLREYREQLAATVQRTDAQARELAGLKHQRAAVRAFLGTDPDA